jgi:DNA-binding phage protein
MFIKGVLFKGNMELESVVEQKVKSLVDGAMRKFLGVTISELEKDITAKLRKWSPFLDFDIDTKVKFKQAKKLFKQYYFKRLLRGAVGNVSDVAKVSCVARESIHRILRDMNVKIDNIRSEINSKDYGKEESVKSVIEKSLEHYKPVLHPQKFDAIYKNANLISKDIAKELPERPMSYKEAEREFEVAYLKKALSENMGNISQTARQVGLRFETLHRKLKLLNII